MGFAGLGLVFVTLGFPTTLLAVLGGHVYGCVLLVVVFMYTCMGGDTGLSHKSINPPIPSINSTNAPRRRLLGGYLGVLVASIVTTLTAGLGCLCSFLLTKCVDRCRGQCSVCSRPCRTTLTFIHTRTHTSI